MMSTTCTEAAKVTNPGMGESMVRYGLGTLSSRWKTAFILGLFLALSMSFTTARGGNLSRAEDNANVSIGSPFGLHTNSNSLLKNLTFGNGFLTPTDTRQAIPTILVPIATTFSHPLAEGRLTQEYGVHPTWRKGNSVCHHVPHRLTYHAGEDWAADLSTPVRSVANGIVYRYQAWYNTYPGRVVVIEHNLGNGEMVYSMYGHLGTVNVREGDLVYKGQIIGTQYDQGYDTHLHWEMRYFGDGSNICGFYAGPGYTYPWHPDYFGYTDPSDFIANYTAPTLTGGRVLGNDGVSIIEPLPLTDRSLEVVEPGETRQAETYWGMLGMDAAGPRPDACTTSRDAVFLIGWDQGDVAEYLVDFQAANETYNLRIVGLPDDPNPVKVEIYIDGRLVGEVEWAGSDPNCRVEGNSGVFEISGYQGVHAVAFMFANDSLTCGSLHDDSCDRNFWFDYFRLEQVGDPIPITIESRTTDKIHGTVLDEAWNRLGDIQVSLWCNQTGQYITTVTDANGIFQFTDLDPDLKYDLAVNAEILGRDGKTSLWQRLDANHPVTVLYDIELADIGDGWFTVDIRLFEH
jgi:murein DD-endopeptidase MepM/ murein hydrolase activator NlpD